ncbi:hypothetical protein J4449_04505 [Candidatus Woesearchaeota archaeon]|nr:hypothetical protein [Candidatus Woesearchaeota archaeon]
MSKKFYWVESSESDLIKEYKRIGTKQSVNYRGKTSVWWGKTGWLSWTPLVLAIETDQQENRAGIHYLSKGDSIKIASFFNSGNVRCYIQIFYEKLDEIGISMETLLDSLEKVPNLNEKNKKTLDKLVDVLNPSKEKKVSSESKKPEERSKELEKRVESPTPKHRSSELYRD